jgi:hypothetical protein
MSENSRIELALAYLAGIIFGDGYVSIARAVRKGVEYFAPFKEAFAKYGPPEQARPGRSSWGRSER